MKLASVLATLLTLLGACGPSEAETKTLRTLSSGPIWTSSDLGWHTDKAHLYDVMLDDNPPYWEGAAPVRYEEAKSPGGVLFFHQFSAFQNQFVLDKNFTIIGARTVDSEKRLVAEARVRYYADSGRQGRELEEFHYDGNGALAFHCISKLDGSGYKAEERDAAGRKRADYYAVWPRSGDAVDNSGMMHFLGR